MRAAFVFPLSLLFACGGNSSTTDEGADTAGSESGGSESGDDGGAVTEPDRPIFAVDVLPLSPGFVALTQPSETVEVVAFTFESPPQLWRVEVGGDVAEAVHELVEPPNEYAPSAVRGSDGSLHVVWESTPNVRYATDSSGTWTEITIADGESPSIALAADGTPHVAFVRRPIANDVHYRAVVARLDGDTWTTETLRDVGDTRPWTAISGTDAGLVIAGTAGDGTLWVQIDEGGEWVEQPIDISEFLPVPQSADCAIAAGPAGIVLTFQSNLRHYGAFLPAGATDFEVRDLGAAFEVELEQPAAGAGENNVFIGGVETLGSRLAVLAPGDPYWPLTAAVPWPVFDCVGYGNALSLDADDQPIVAAFCDDDLFVFRTVGVYPPEYDERCSEAVDALCDEACGCGTTEAECGFFSDYGDIEGNRAGCLLAAREALCSNSTQPIEVLTSCLESFSEPSMCTSVGYPLSDVCSSLRDVE